MKPEGRRARLTLYSLAFAGIAAALIGGRVTGSFADVRSAGPSSSAQAAASPPPGLRLDATHTVGAPLIDENLAVFPIYASVQEDIGEFTTLDAAIERGTAIVRELDAASAPSDGAARGLDNSHHGGGSAQVNQLVIENKGSVAILVLAGTIVKGGRQDRQIGADFVVAAGKSVPVDAYCVEHGRWSADRNGVSTGGKFEATKSLATSKVRAAGQHEHNQSNVWSEVSEVNAANKKSAASGTLLATLDDKEIAAKRASKATKSAAFFGGVPQADKVVGLAYAVSGKVKGVRWFLNHKLFAMNKDTLIGTAAVEAITDQEQRKADGGQAKPSLPPGPSAVVEFIADIQAAAVKEKQATKADNVNEYRSAKSGYGSSTYMKPSATATAAPAAAATIAPPKAVTEDFVSK